MTKKTVAIVGGAGQIAARIAHIMLDNPGAKVTVINTDDIAEVKLDVETMTIGYDPKMVESLMGSLTEQELYGITLHEAHRLVLEGRLGSTDYKIPNAPVKDVKIDVSDDLPKNAKKPKFLLEQNHSIRGFRR